MTSSRRVPPGPAFGYSPAMTRTRTPNYGFIIDNRRCIGCHACTVACKTEHGDPIGINKTWVQYIEKGTWPEVTRGFHVLRCNHCANAPCVEICPTACLETRDDGIVDFDPSRCIGCKACMQACPYDAITINPDSGTATKCNYCAHRVDVGREPACAVVCPAEAIVTGDLDDPNSRIAQLMTREKTTVRRPEKGTEPKLAYIEGDADAPNPFGARRSTRTLWGERPTDAIDRRDELAAGLGAGSLAAFVEGLTNNQKNGNGTPDTLEGNAIQNHVAQEASISGVRPSAEFSGPTSQSGPVRTYDIASRHAASWGWKVSAYRFTKSIAAGGFLLPALLALFGETGAVVDRMFAIGVPLALFFLAVTGVLLVADLKRPERFHWVLLRPQWSSWLVRGAYIITAYGGLLTYWFLFGGTPGGVISTTGALLAAATAAYSGWLFGQAKGRDLWQSPLVPLHLLIQAAVCGAATLLLIEPTTLGDLAGALQIALAVDAAMILVELHGRHASDAASRARKLLTQGSRRLWLYGGSLLIGHLLPIVLLATGDPTTCALAAFLGLVGVAVYEHLWVDAPQRLPLA